MFIRIISIIVLVFVCTTFAFKIKATQASGGEDHTLVEFTGNTLFACGSNGLRQLGIGDVSESYELEQVLSGQQNGLPDTFLENIVSFDGGWQHSIACDSNKFCWTWGSNANSCLGTGNSGPTYTPVQVLSGQQDPNETYLQNIIQVSAGRSGTHSLVIEDETGRCLSFGSNSLGQLSISSYGNIRSVPQLILCGE